jgi:hypothetical protein
MLGSDREFDFTSPGHDRVDSRRMAEISFMAKVFALLVLFTRGAFAVVAYVRSRRDTGVGKLKASEPELAEPTKGNKADDLDEEWIHEQW